MSITNSIRKYVIREFRCELETSLPSEQVWERLHEITSEGISWPWRTSPPFIGTIEADEFKISYRKLDPGVELNGIVEATPAGSRILVTACLGVAHFSFFIFCMIVLAWILWQAVPADDSRFIALWAVGVPAIAALLRWLNIRAFGEHVDKSLACLKSELGATDISHEYD